MSTDWAKGFWTGLSCGMSIAVIVISVVAMLGQL